MKILKLLLLLVLSSVISFGQNLKPYILGLESSKSISDIKSTLKANLKQNGISVIGEYRPAGDANRWILIITSPELKRAVAATGGLTGFGAAMRIAITTESGKSKVSFTNPDYWGNAYFRSSYPKVSNQFAMLEAKIEKSLTETGSFIGSSFGSEDGISAVDLRKYHYMLGMPYFDDTEELGEFGSHNEAVSKIRSSISRGVPNVKKIYEVSIAGKNITLFGFGLSGADGESRFMPIIDIGTPKHTAFLPYELLVINGEVHMLHGRFRIALSFPDLTMSTFTKIMSTPGDIEELLEQLVE